MYASFAFIEFDAVRCAAACTYVIVPYHHNTTWMAVANFKIM